MGAWGAAAFENDAALAWFASLERDGAGVITGAFDRLDDAADGYLDFDTSACAIAAADVIARLRSSEFRLGPPHVDMWVRANIHDHWQPLAMRAAGAIEVVRRPEQNEFYGWWSDGSEVEVWLRRLTSIRQRLKVLP